MGAYTGAEAAEHEANWAEQSSKNASKQLARDSTPENISDEDVQVPAISPSARLAGESQGGTTIALCHAARVPPLQRSVSVPCRAGVIIAPAPSTLIACETHVTSRREVYCPPSPSALLAP